MSGFDLSGHRCFGCGKELSDGDTHTHFSLDEWGQREGLEAIGFDVGMTLCVDCTHESPNGWLSLEAHDIAPGGGTKQ